MITPTTSTDLGTSMRTSSDSSTAFGTRGDRPFARVSWGSIFAGALIAMAVQLILTLIGTAIGLATLDPGTSDNPSATALGAGAAIWLLISSVISLFVGGYIAARLGGTFNGWLHGLTTWAVVTMLTLILLSTAVGNLIGSASGLGNFSAGDLRRSARQTSERASSRSGDSAAAEAAANRGAASSGAAALGLILGALAAAFGGRKGERDLGRRDAFGSTGHTANPATMRG